MATTIDKIEYICKIHKITMEQIYLNDFPGFKLICRKCSPETPTQVKE